MLSIRGWKTVFVPFSLMRLFFAPKEKPVPCPTVKCPHPPHPVERTFHVSFCPLFVAGTGRKVSLESPNFQLFTLYRKFGGLTWDLTMVLSMYVWKTSGRNCVSSTGKICKKPVCGFYGRLQLCTIQLGLRVFVLFATVAYKKYCVAFSCGGTTVLL